jgi:lipopolysaccharide export system protein LptA
MEHEMMMKPSVSKQAASMIGFMLIALPGLVFAQSGRGSGPIEITANDIDMQPQQRVALLTGNAAVIQDGAILRAARIRITYTGTPSGDMGEIDKVFTETETFYVTPTERVRGDRAVFDRRTNTVQFTGNVIVTQGQNVLKGAVLTLNTQTRASTMRGLDGRVRAVFFPTTKQPAAKATPVSAPKRN